MSCPSCGSVAAEGARFCSTCGQALFIRADERRVATVVFADLVGYTSLSESADPEQIKNLVDDCFELLVRDVTSFGGKVDKIVGDAIIALFGAPVAHEDDAERAVRAALRMQETLAAYRAEVDAEVPVQVRIGVNTGEVLVGALRAGGDYTAMGDAVNTAQRLQVAALPGGVVVGPSTYAATREVIAYRSLGPVGVKGRDEPVEAWVAIETLLPPGHRPRRSQTPFVGRETELGVLGHAIDATVERQRSHFVLLIGEAGVGKSRLAEETAAVARERHGAMVFEGRCVPYGEANVWWPIAEALRQACEIAPDDPLPVATAALLRRGGRGARPAGDLPGRPPGRRRPALPHGLRGAAPRDRSAAGPRGGHPRRPHLHRGRGPGQAGGDRAERPALGGLARPRHDLGHHRPAQPPAGRARGHRPPVAHRALVGADRPAQHRGRQPRSARAGRHR